MWIPKGGNFWRAIELAFSSVLESPSLIKAPLIEAWFDGQKEGLHWFQVTAAAALSNDITHLVTMLASHASQSPQIPKMCKGLQEVSLSLDHNERVWPGPTLFAMHAMFVRSDFDAENQECYALFRQICREAYLGFLISRCFQTFRMSAVPFLPDAAFLKMISTVFIGEVVKIPHFLERWITDGLEELKTISGPFMWAIKSLRRTCAQVDIRAMVDSIDQNFFDFSTFFREMPQSSSPLAMMFSSTLIEIASRVRDTLFALLRNEYCEKLGSDVTETFEQLWKEIKRLEVPADQALLFQTIKKVRTYESICDMAIAFDSVDIFQSKASDKKLVPSSRILRLGSLLLLFRRDSST